MSYDQDEEATDQLLLAVSQVYEERIPICVSYDQDKEATNQLFLASSQVYEDKIASELPLTASQSSQQGDLANQVIIPKEKQSICTNLGTN